MLESRADSLRTTAAASTLPPLRSASSTVSSNVTRPAVSLSPAANSMAAGHSDSLNASRLLRFGSFEAQSGIAVV